MIRTGNHNINAFIATANFHQYVYNSLFILFSPELSGTRYIKWLRSYSQRPKIALLYKHYFFGESLENVDLNVQF